MGLRPFVVKRATKSMGMYQFFLGIVLGIYVGFLRLNQLRFIAQDPLLTGILKVSGLPPQSTLWRFLAALHLNVAVQILRCSSKCGNGCGRRRMCA